MEQLIRATLAEIEYEMERLYWNKNQEEMASPFRNTGGEYANNIFQVRAYDWNEETDSANFVYKDLKIWWYKYFRRGIEWVYKGERHADIPSNFLATMLNECFESINNDFKGKN